jgi:hypothetical protein
MEIEGMEGSAKAIDEYRECSRSWIVLLSEGCEAASTGVIVGQKKIRRCQAIKRG